MGGLVVLSLGLWASLAVAQQQSVVEDMLDVLRANGQISAQQYQQLLGKAQAQKVRPKHNGQHETLRVMKQQIQELKEEVRRLKATPYEPGRQPVEEKKQEVKEAQARQEANFVPAAIEQRLQGVEKSLLGLSGIRLGGMLYGSYNFNFQNPDSRTNNLRIFDTRANTFVLDLFQLSIAKDTEGGLGFKTVLDFGRTANLIQSDWNREGELGNGTDNFALQEAYLSYHVDAGKGLDIRFGKFAALLGSEGIESPLNYNISRSFLSGFAVPFTTGCLRKTAACSAARIR